MKVPHDAAEERRRKVRELLTRGVAEVIGVETLEEALLSGEQLRVKLGIDPTSTNIHLGRTVPLLKLRDFQELGCTIVFIIGDFTGVIGDTSDKESERPMLTAEAVQKNAETYLAQVGKLLDLDKVEVRYNSEWLGELTYREIGEHAEQFSVADFIARENIKKRLEAGKRVSLREVLYPLMQGYDSVAIDADVEIGGTDQRFNLLAGRTLQEHFNKKPQQLLMTELIPGLDGRKMSSSWGNTINLTDVPEDMYGKVMRLNDDLMSTYFAVCTRLPTEEVQALLSANPRDAKMRLAHEITQLYHGAEAAGQAQAQFVSTFQQRQVPEDVMVRQVERGVLLGRALQEVGLVQSQSEFRRLVAQGGVHDVDAGVTIEDTTTSIEAPITIKIGKRHFVRFEL